MIEKSLSKKLQAANFSLLMLVVILHSQNVSNRIHGFNPAVWNYWIQNFISTGICIVAVPFFFTISGFLFFSEQPLLVVDFKEKFLKRIRTLLVPYLLVSLASILLIYSLQKIPFTKNYFNNDLKVDPVFLLKAWLLNPLSYQLWFLRNLIILVVFSPVIYFLIRILQVWGVVLIGIAWLLLSDPMLMRVLTSLFFFMLGGYLRVFKLEKLNSGLIRFKVIWLVVCWFALIVTAFSFGKTWYGFVAGNLSLLIGMLTVWALTSHRGVLNFFEMKFVARIMPFSFFVYLFHEPLLTAVIKLMFALLGVSDLTSIITFIVSPFLVVSICIALGTFLREYLAPVYNVLTGARG